MFFVRSLTAAVDEVSNATLTFMLVSDLAIAVSLFLAVGSR
jgi:hypothetical protein